MSNIGKIIQVYDNQEGEVGLFKFLTDQASEEHLEHIFKEYFEMDEDDADLFLNITWGIERVYIDFEVNI